MTISNVPSGRAAGRLRDLSETLVDRPPVALAVLGVVGLAVRHAWLTTRPLAAGDWHWPSRGRLLAWFPWPTVWDSTLGLGGENRFLEVFRFPIFAVSGIVAAAGGTWTLSEKVVYFVPFAVLLPAAGWLLAREILGRTRWTLLAPVLLLGNTYFLLEADGHVPLPLAEVMACLALVAFLRAMRTYSRRYALLSGLLLSVAAVCDVRGAYLGVWLMASYLVVLSIVEPGWRPLRRRLGLAVGAAVAFGATQAFWIIPVLTYHGHPGFPTPQAPNFNIITLGHGIAGVSAAWSGGTPAALVQAPLNPVFMLVPLLALLPLAARRVRPELLWLGLVALVCAFLAKTNTPPLGQVYDWLFLHLPGFRLFREGSKFLFPVSVAYAILVPAALQGLYQDSTRLRMPFARWARWTWMAGLAAVLAIMASTILVLQRGQMGSTTTPVAQPDAFTQVSQLIGSDAHPGPVLWFGSPVYGAAGKNHHYVITSEAHPVFNLTGIISTTMVNQRDTFQYFCPAINQAFCYLRPDLFPYLVKATGSTFIVSPGSANVGNLPKGITRTWLRDQLTALFGTPRQMGSKGTDLLVWRAPAPPPAIAGYPAIAVVDSGPWSARNVLPALQALGVPAAYRQTFDRADFPAVRAGLPDSVSVVPNVDGGCRSTAPRQVGILAQTSQPTLSATIAGSPQVLALLSRPPRLAGWGLYGPVTIPVGLTTITATTATTATATTATTAGGGVDAIGPCVEWSPLTVAALGERAPSVGAVLVSSHGEQLSAAVTAPAPAWVELRRLYDPGWRLGTQKPQALADGLFNLYHGAPVSKGRFHFHFSTMFWEHLGQAVALLSLILILLVARRSPGPADDRAGRPGPVPLGGGVARIVGVVGVALLGVTALIIGLQWLGAPTRFPWLALGRDPYTIDQSVGSVALAVLALSIALRLVRSVLDRRHPPRHRARRWRRRHSAYAVLVSVCLLAAACTPGPATGAQALASAQNAGQTLPVSSDPLDAAQVQRAAKQARTCIADYTSALRSFPGLASAYTGRAACYLSGSINAAAAVHDDAKALTLSPDRATGYLDLADASRAIGNLVAATRDFTLAADVPSAAPSDILKAIDGVLAVGTISQAQPILLRASIRFPDSAIIELAAADVAIAADDGSADASLARALRLAGGETADEALVLAHLCHWQLLRHDDAGAIASCSRSVDLSRDGSGAYDDLSAAHAAAGQLDAAIADVSNAIGAFVGSSGPYSQSAGVDGFGLAGLLEQRGRLEVERHETTLALADYQQAKRSLRSSSPDFLARLKADVNTARTD